LIAKSIELSKATNNIKKSTHHKNTVAIRFSGNEESKRLNNLYRRKNYATNVLTFSYGEYPQITADILICIPVAEKEARVKKIQLDQHVAHLIVHGVLHAAGYDHSNLSEATEMEQLEVNILKRFRIPNPYLRI
tara:strand:- start:75 stop:476 length:402 start_codon:yes stop_codon:yes gene_type:complete